MDLEERVAELETKLHAALARIEILEKGEPRSEGELGNEESMPYEYEIAGFKKNSKVTVFVGTDGEHYLTKTDALVFLGVTRTTGFPFLDRLVYERKIHVGSLEIGKGQYFLLNELKEVRQALYSPKSKEQTSKEESGVSE